MFFILLFQFVSNAEDVVIEDVGDGNLNYLYKVYKKENPSMGIIVKTAPAFIKVRIGH